MLCIISVCFEELCLFSPHELDIDVNKRLCKVGTVTSSRTDPDLNLEPFVVHLPSVPLRETYISRLSISRWSLGHSILANANKSCSSYLALSISHVNPISTSPKLIPPVNPTTTTPTWIILDYLHLSLNKQTPIPKWLGWRLPRRKSVNAKLALKLECASSTPVIPLQTLVRTGQEIALPASITGSRLKFKTTRLTRSHVWSVMRFWPMRTSRHLHQRVCFSRESCPILSYHSLSFLAKTG